MLINCNQRLFEWFKKYKRDMKFVQKQFLGCFCFKTEKQVNFKILLAIILFGVFVGKGVVALGGEIKNICVRYVHIRNDLREDMCTG